MISLFGQLRPGFGNGLAPWLLVPLIGAAGSVGCAPEPVGHPNIILMMADDMGMGDTSAYQDFTGNPDDLQVHTPSMERLANIGVRFTDAHTPSSRCTPTRYGLLTGRYPWRNRLKHWVLFGTQGDPMIEADRPTIASMLRDEGYATAMFGKWHVGLRYRRSDGSPADAWADADLTQPLHTSPLDHGFDEARYTSRSHGTSGPHAPEEDVGNGPGHVHGRVVAAATGRGKRLETTGDDAYVLHRLGSRHSDNAMRFLSHHISSDETSFRPFFLYYPSNSNHGPYTPDESIGGVPVAGAGRTVSGAPMDNRHDYIYENDVALGRMLDWLEETDDPRNGGRRLIETTIVIFTSDNGAERDSDTATGPFRSNKGSAYEGGHRVPFIVSWPDGGVGDGDSSTPGTTNRTPISLTDMYATFAEVVGAQLPDLRSGGKGAEDSFSVLSAFRGERLAERPPLFFNDHKEEGEDPAAAAIRIDSPRVGTSVEEGQWKLFFDPSLLREGNAQPTELFNLATDPMETTNLLAKSELAPLVGHLTAQALLHRNSGGHRLAPLASRQSTTIDWTEGEPVVGDALGMVVSVDSEGEIVTGDGGLGVRGGTSDAVDNGEALLFRFAADVIVESAAIYCAEEAVGGFYRVGPGAPLAIYCINGDIDHKDQSGILSDIGILRQGESLRLDSGGHFGTEQPGEWWLRRLTVRALQ